MAEAATLTAVKLALRISHTSLDADIAAEIDACMNDLAIVEIDQDKAIETDPAILSAIKLWCKAQYADDVEKFTAYRAAYDALKGTLMMAEDYGGYVEETT